ncbi:hypothetical protein [Neoaquamicrobium sediminum]|uniref:hypothetical protein n=1 Tax=Neoaquamicrobium sediminum TaxID=1849104 RepID=UPI00360937DF
MAFESRLSPARSNGGVLGSHGGLVKKENFVSEIINAETRGLFVSYAKRSPESGFVISAANGPSEDPVWKINAIAVDWIFYKEKSFAGDCDSDRVKIDDIMNDLLGSKIIAFRVSDNGRIRIIFSEDRYVDITIPNADDDLYWVIGRVERWILAFGRDGMRFTDLGRVRGL